MVTVTKKAAAVLKAAKVANGAPPDAGIRILKGTIPDQPEALAVGFAITDDPRPDDEEFEEEGLRIFVEDCLIEPLDGRTLDVHYVDEGPELVWR
jgi:Fe-S cluster assembly iron-binding protein IscA